MILLPEGWQLESGWAVPYVRDVTPPEGIVVGLGPNGEMPSTDSVLLQQVDVSAGTHYKLAVRSWPLGIAVDECETLSHQERARLELYWLANGRQLGEPTILPLDGRGFATHAWAGISPDGATEAKIRLIQPQGKGNLVVQSVSLSRSDLLSVPLTFLAEAPGELTVSDLRVAYEPATEAEEGLDMQRDESAAGVIMPVAEVRSMEARGPTRLAAQPVGIIAGVGTATEGSLAAAGVTTVGDI